MQNQLGITPKNRSELKYGKMVEQLVEKMKVIEGIAKYPGVDLSLMTLISGFVLSRKFKRPEFEKFNATQNPVIPLTKYRRKMANYTRDDKIIIHCFKESFEGGTVECYANSDKACNRTLNDLVNTYAMYYKYNVELDLTRDTPRTLKRKKMKPLKNILGDGG